MNGMDKIIARIQAEAKAESDAILAEAKTTAEAIAADYAQKAQDTYNSRLTEGTAELEQQVQRSDRAAGLDAKKSVLATKQELVNTAYSQAKAAITALPEDEYIAFLARMADEAAADGKGELILNAADRARIGEKVLDAARALAAKRGVSSELTLSEATEDISGGLILKNGSISANCTLDSLVELSRSSLDAAVAGILFG